VFIIYFTTVVHLPVVRQEGLVTRVLSGSEETSSSRKHIKGGLDVDVFHNSSQWFYLIFWVKTENKIVYR